MIIHVCNHPIIAFTSRSAKSIIMGGSAHTVCCCRHSRRKSLRRGGGCCTQRVVIVVAIIIHLGCTSTTTESIIVVVGKLHSSIIVQSNINTLRKEKSCGRCGNRGHSNRQWRWKLCAVALVSKQQQQVLLLQQQSKRVEIFDFEGEKRLDKTQQDKNNTSRDKFTMITLKPQLRCFPGVQQHTLTDQ